MYSYAALLAAPYSLCGVCAYRSYDVTVRCCRRTHTLLSGKRYSPFRGSNCVSLLPYGTKRKSGAGCNTGNGVRTSTSAFSKKSAIRLTACRVQLLQALKPQWPITVKAIWQSERDVGQPLLAVLEAAAVAFKKKGSASARRSRKLRPKRRSSEVPPRNCLRVKYVNTASTTNL
jgi:hypothetical protein